MEVRVPIYIMCFTIYYLYFVWLCNILIIYYNTHFGEFDFFMIWCERKYDTQQSWIRNWNAVGETVIYVIYGDIKHSFLYLYRYIKYKQKWNFYSDIGTCTKKPVIVVFVLVNNTYWYRSSVNLSVLNIKELLLNKKWY